MPIRARCTINPLTTAELVAAKNHYTTYGLVTLPGMTDVTELRPTLREIYDKVGHLAHLAADPHRVDASGALLGGRRLHRLDPDLHELGAHITDEFETSGLSAWADQFAATAIPTLNEITGYRLTYDRPFMLVYREGDYIAAHGEKYDGHRVNVQIAIPYDTVSCMRVLKDGF